MFSQIPEQRILEGYHRVRDDLLQERTVGGNWEGELSTSALSTATAVVALNCVRINSQSVPLADSHRFQQLIEGGLNWLASHQNEDGGWGDTVKSLSNISTSMLARAAFLACEADVQYPDTIARAVDYIESAGGIDAVLRRYGKDRTFSVPILTHCAIAGFVPWEKVIPLPFELACIPARWYSMVRMPVVSYALPALIAIGQVRYHHAPPVNPITRLVRWMAKSRSLRVLEKIQPVNGGFLEATPLTSFVTMSLASIGQADSPVTQRGIRFIVESVCDDGSWPIDTNLATWVTTLSVNALESDLPESSAERIVDWLLQQQYCERHPYTNAAPGGWAWTDLPGGVPDADDTPGSMLALLEMFKHHGQILVGQRSRMRESLNLAIEWLLDLQNRDGGWPTFCRGWGTLPFDKSSADITAHVIRALHRSLQEQSEWTLSERDIFRVNAAIEKGFAFLLRQQRSDGTWLPLWFGNQYVSDESNATYGTARVLQAYVDCQRLDSTESQSALEWLCRTQCESGGWGGGESGSPTSIEETSLAVDVLVSAIVAMEQLSSEDAPSLLYTMQSGADAGLKFLLQSIESGDYDIPTPIGFYFAKLWYFERLYPKTFITSALRRAATLVRSRDDQYIGEQVVEKSG